MIFKNVFSKKSQARISLYLGINRMALCHMYEGRAHLLAKTQITSESQWAESFDTFVHEHKLAGTEVSVVLSRDFYQTFDIEKPKIDESELLASLPFTIKDLVADSIFDLVVDYYDMPLQQHKGEQITAVCILKKRVIKIRDMVLKHAMTLKEITIEEMAVTRLLGNKEEADILLSQQNNELVLTVVKQGQLYFSHRLRGFNELLGRPLADVEGLLLDSLSLELQRALDYINSQLRVAAIGHLYLAVTCPDITLLAEKLGDYLARNVVPFGEPEQYDFNNILTYGLLMGTEGK